jgi:hypothetical protein
MERRMLQLLKHKITLLAVVLILPILLGGINVRAAETTLDPAIAVVLPVKNSTVTDKGNTCMRTSCQGIQILDTGYGKLQSRLNTENWNNLAGVNAFADEFLPDSKARFSNGTGVTYSSDCMIFVKRADSEIFSYIRVRDDLDGGADMAETQTGFNFDPKTGAALTLRDVVADYDKICSLTLLQLKSSEYASSFDEGYEDVVRSMFYGSGTDLQWVLDRQGLTILIGQNLIAPHSLGTIYVSIPFAGEESIFRKAYRAAGRGMIAALEEDTSYPVGGTSVRYDISYEGEPSELGKSTLTIRWNGADTKFSCEGKEYNNVYLVSTRTGKMYLYAVYMTYSDHQSTDIYDLNGSSPAAAGESDALMEGSSDPDAFYVISKVDTLGTCFGYRLCHVGSNGVPVQDTEEYTLLNYTAWWEAKTDSQASVDGWEVLTVKKAIPAVIVSGAKETSVTLPVGTKCYPRKTDGKSYMTMELQDGRTCRISFTGGAENAVIAGIPEKECFSGIFYAS